MHNNKKIWKKRKNEVKKDRKPNIVQILDKFKNSFLFLINI